jgi:hypothetical protein
MERNGRRTLIVGLAWFLGVLWLIPTVRAGTAAIDDTDGDSQTGAKPSYSGSWYNSSQFCEWCMNHNLDMSQVYNETWHASGHNGDAVALSFTGKPMSVPIRRRLLMVKRDWNICLPYRTKYWGAYEGRVHIGRYCGGTL